MAASDYLDTRLAEQAVRFVRGGADAQAVIEWLEKMGCKAQVMQRSEDGQPSVWAVDGCTGIRAGFVPVDDPVTVAVNLGFVLAGEYWPQVYPHLLRAVDRLWKEERSQTSETPQHTRSIRQLTLADTDGA